MRLFQKTIFPFSTTGAVCNLSLYENGEIVSSSSESQFTESLQILNEFEITHFLFFGFSTEKNWEFYKSKLELAGYHCKIIQLPTLPTEKSTVKEFMDYIKGMEDIFHFIGKSNFKIFFPAQKKHEISEFLFGCFLHLDRSLTVPDLEEYFLGNESLDDSLRLKLESYGKFLNSNPYLVLKKTPSLKGRAEVIQKEKELPQNTEIPAQVKAGDFELNLSALSGKEPEPLPSNPSIELNLSSLSEEEPFFQEKEEDPEELLEDVLGFAENFDTPDNFDWDSAFADTGQKVEDNFTAKDNVFLEKGDEVESEKPILEESTEDFSFSTLIDLDAITNGKIDAYSEDKKEESANKEKTSPEDSDSRIPFPDVLNLDNLPLDEIEKELIAPLPEETLEEPESERIEEPTPTVEINIDPSNTFIDRHIKDALTKEILVDEDDPRKKKTKDPKKDSKPVTIIVTAEKEEDVRPLSKDKLKKLSSDFNAIQLD